MALDFPATPSNGQQFTSGGTIWTWDGAKWVAGATTSAFAPVNSPVFTGDPQAPQPAAGDADASIATTAFVTNAVATSLHDVGRNYVHNSMFNVQQRGSGSWSASGNYTADRWVQFFGGGSMATSVNPSGDGARAQTGDESMAYQLYTTFTGTAGASDLALMQQNIEGVRRLAGKTVTLSFWAASGTGSKVGVNLEQNFGTGGSPSSIVAQAGVAFTLTGGFVRYSATFTMPSVAGKTLGTNNNDCTQLSFWYSSGSTYAARAGNIGAQTGNISIWGVQLELGTVATPLEKLDPVTQLQQCQRFYCVLRQLSMIASGAATQALGQTCALPVPMHHVPGLAFANTTYGNMSGITATNVQPTSVLIFATLVGSAGGQWTTDLLASADL